MRRYSFPAILILLVTLSLPACTVWAPPKHATWKNATGAEQFERLLWQDIQAKNWQQVEAHLASTYVFMAENGLLDRSQRLQVLKEFEISDISIGDLVVTPQGLDLIVTYTILIKGAHNGAPLPASPIRMMSVWQQQKSGWILVAQSGY